MPGELIHVDELNGIYFAYKDNGMILYDGYKSKEDLIEQLLKDGYEVQHSQENFKGINIRGK